jgi:hypothetical protein
MVRRGPPWLVSRPDSTEATGTAHARRVSHQADSPTGMLIAKTSRQLAAVTRPLVLFPA